jgi:hypothetical protein
MSPVESASPETGATRLSVRRTLGAAYGILAAHALPFGAIILALTFASEGVLYLAKSLIDAHALRMQAALIESGGQILGAAFAEVMSVIAGVVWLRIILLGEEHRARAYLRFGRRALRYLGLDILFGTLVAGPVLIAALFGMYTAMPHYSEYAQSVNAYILPLSVAAAVWSAECAAWIGLAYPMVATDASDGALRLSFRLSRGQHWPLFLAFLLGVFVWDAAPLALFYALPAEAAGSRTTEFLTTALSFLPRICFVAVSAAAYDHLQHRSAASVAAAFD